MGNKKKKKKYLKCPNNQFNWQAKGRAQTSKQWVGSEGVKDTVYRKAATGCF
jgi:hypothetical protein